MRRIYKDIIFLPCFAHQTNLCIADILKSSSEFLTTSRKAEVVVSYFNASTFFLGELREEQLKIYGNQYSLVKPGKTRWNSYYMCYNSILKNKRALRVSISLFSYINLDNFHIEIFINLSYFFFVINLFNLVTCR